MESLLTAVTYPLAFLVSLGVIVFVHEFGHFAVAKAFGVKVLTFSIGFGKRLLGFQRGGTDYRISALPLGGYVRMGGEMPEEATGDPDEFVSKPRWQRILVYLAGPAANVVLAVVLIAGVFMSGHFAQGLQNLPPEVGFVAEGSAGEAAGLEPGDRILSVGGEPVETWDDFSFLVATSPEKPMELRVERGDEIFETTLVPTKEERNEIGESGLGPELQLRLVAVLEGTPAEEAGLESGDRILTLDGEPVSRVETFVEKVEPRAGEAIEIRVLRDGAERAFTVVPEDVEGKGRVGVSIGYYQPLPLGEALHASVLYNLDVVKKTGEVLAKLFQREVSAKSTLSGPIEIARYSGEAARGGLKSLVFMIGFLSIAIGIMNLLPIPILDGGHITLLLVESAMRRDFSLRVKERFTQVGFFLLMTLMAMVIFFDLSKNLPSLFGS